MASTYQCLEYLYGVISNPNPTYFASGNGMIYLIEVEPCWS